MSLHTCECLVINEEGVVSFCDRPALEKKKTETRGWIWICDICVQLPWCAVGLGTHRHEPNNPKT